MIELKNILVLVTLMFPFQSIWGQDNFYYNYTVKDGLPSNVTYRAVQDNNDLLWIGTEKGISVYDGYNFKTIETGNKLESKDVWKLVKDNYQRIWAFTTNSEPVIFKDGEIFALSELTGKKEGELFAWCSNLGDLTDGTLNNYLLLSHTKDSAFYLNQENELECITFPASVIEDFKDRKILNCTFRNDDLLVLYKNGYLKSFDYSGQTLHEEHKFTLKNPRKIDYSQNRSRGQDHLYLQDGNQLYVLRNNHLVRIISESQSFSVQDIVGVSSDYFFTKKNDRLVSIRRDDWNNTRVLNENIKNAKSIFEDKEKNIWIFSYDNGIYLLPYLSQNAKIYNRTNGLMYPNITCMNFDKEGKLLLGNNFGKATIVFDKNKFYPLPKKESHRDYFIYTDIENNIWTSELKIYQEQNLQSTVGEGNQPITFKQIAQLDNPRVATSFKAYCEQGANYYLGGRSLYLGQKNDNNIKLTKLNYDGQRIYAMSTKSSSEIFLGTTHGVSLYNTRYQTNKLLPFKNNRSNVRSLAYHNGLLWIANDQYGLVVYDAKKDKRTTIPWFKEHIIAEIYIDPSNEHTWLSTNKGLYKVVLNSLNKMDLDIQLFSTTNGLPTNEVNSCRIKGEEIYVGTSEGLAILKNERIDISYRPKISLGAVYIHGNLVENKREYNLKSGQNHLTIEFTTISFSSLGNIRYEYKLEGISDQWTSIKGRVLEFPNLSPGEYKLTVVGYDALGHQTSNQISITVNIKTPIYKRWWFIVIAGLILIALLVYTFYTYDKKDRLSKQLTALKFQALQSQLNSHFIFNALNAIQMYVLTHDTRSVNKYMSQFALLIRSYLDSSRNRSVALSNEIKFLKTYISLEELINEDKFDIEYLIDPNLNLNNTIPSNIIQPFVENAIIHGLLPLENKGLLTLRFLKLSKKEVQCEIEDNGVGYRISKKNKKTKKSSHGLDILKERIAVLKKAHGFKIDLMLIDKSYGNKNESGTLVVIKFRNERTA